MKKVLILNAACNIGSTGRIANEIGVTAQNNGYEVLFAHSSRYGRKTTLPNYKVGNNFEEYLHAFIYHRALGLDSLGSIIPTKNLIKKIKEYNPDIVHLHNIHGYYINFKLLFEYLNSTKIKIIWTLHDCWSFTGGCTFLNYFKCDKWKCGCGDCPLHKDFPKHSIFDHTDSSFNLKKVLFANKNITLIPVSNWLKGLMDYSLLKDLNVLTIHNGVDLNVFNINNSTFKIKYNIQENNIVLGVASPWSKRKGLDDFIKLRDKLNHIYVIVLVGLSRNQIAMLPEGIIGIERTSNQRELAEIYSASSVYVNPTYSDNFPTTNIEALACGTPVISYQTGGSCEAFDHDTGIAIHTGDIVLLKSTIEFMCNQDREQLRKRCRTRAENLFNKEDRYQEYIELYNKNIL
ncbi:MAG: glycosyltransferase [Eubacteriales bacterium]|nr:glycosyltransferase [Eubacteriales bacterium]